MRVANFSNIELPGDHLLNFDSEDIETIVNKIRRYADLPYVYVAAKEKARADQRIVVGIESDPIPLLPICRVFNR